MSRTRFLFLLAAAGIAAWLLLAGLEPPDYESCHVSGWQMNCEERDR